MPKPHYIQNEQLAKKYQEHYSSIGVSAYGHFPKIERDVEKISTAPIDVLTYAQMNKNLPYSAFPGAGHRFMVRLRRLVRMELGHDKRSLEDMMH